ncbi:MAG TPA: glycosyl hydrolase family 65 protein [Bryobacteraceae bacterium]
MEEFNRAFPEEVVNAIPDQDAAAWMEQNVPWFSCPDPDVERTWYYRWWALRKHIKQTPRGYILTEFLKPVKHASEYGAISCALGLHLAEGRWIHDPKYLDDYVRFWLESGEGGGLQKDYHHYSGWTAAAVYDRWLVDGRSRDLVSLLDPLIRDYKAWERERLLPGGLFWQYDVRDGMEESVSGSRHNRNARPTINSYMYGNAVAIAAIARMAGKPSIAAEFDKKARNLRALVEQKLWDREAVFFKSRLDTGKLADVREIIGYTPWYFDLPEKNRGYERAWKQLMDARGFYAPYGPTTAERRSPGFRIADTGDACQWNGPSWPFSTSITLRALANVLNDYPQSAVSDKHFFDTFLIYTRSQKRKRENGAIVPWIDENLNPLTGEWWARTLQIRRGTFYGRGDHYNHSSYADLVITGLVGLRPQPNNLLVVKPLLPADAWDWFCLDHVRYHGHLVTILWDRTGMKFHRGKGLRVFSDGHEIVHADRLTRVSGSIE